MLTFLCRIPARLSVVHPTIGHADLQAYI